MSLVLCYCEKCGQHWDVSDKRLSNLKNITCIGCCSIGFFKPVPEQYLNEGKWDINKNLEQEFIENIVKSSPNFDQTCWDRRVGFKDVSEHQYEIIKAHIEEQLHQPECPTCHSKNIQRISGIERGASIIGLGIFSNKINKSFKCDNCGYTW